MSSPRNDRFTSFFKAYYATKTSPATSVTPATSATSVSQPTILDPSSASPLHSSVVTSPAPITNLPPAETKEDPFLTSNKTQIAAIQCSGMPLCMNCNLYFVYKSPEMYNFV